MASRAGGKPVFIKGPRRAAPHCTPCPSPGRHRPVPTAASHQALGQILQDGPSSTAGRGSPMPQNLPLGQGYPQTWVRPAVVPPGQAWLTARMGTPYSLGLHSLPGESGFPWTQPLSAPTAPTGCPSPAFSTSLLSQPFLLLMSMCSLGFQAVQIPLGQPKALPHFLSCVPGTGDTTAAANSSMNYGKADSNPFPTPHMKSSAQGSELRHCSFLWARPPPAQPCSQLG